MTAIDRYIRLSECVAAGHRVAMGREHHALPPDGVEAVDEALRTLTAEMSDDEIAEAKWLMAGRMQRRAA